MSTKIYTRTGDGGDTGLFRGGRVPKNHIRVEAYGTVDELCAAIGLVLTFEPPESVASLLTEIQSLLFEVGADLATPADVNNRPAEIREEDVQRLERAIDGAEADLPTLKSFILPGGTRAAAALHLARAVCRRAERLCVALTQVEPDTSLMSVKLLNRLSDLLFVLARRCNHLAGVPDVLWRTRGR